MFISLLVLEIENKGTFSSGGGRWWYGRWWWSRGGDGAKGRHVRE